jgi:hypothetical protein
MGAARIRVASFLFVVVAVSLICPNSGAAERFVRAGATGSGTGADWDNAWSSFDTMNWSSINPGDTVYIAAGTYGVLTVIKSGKLGSPITFKRATVAEHGASTVAGWSAAYDGRVIIDGGGGLAAVGFGEGGDWMSKSFVTIDGATRYGIWLRNATYGVRADRGPSCDNIILRFLEIGDPGIYKLGEDGIQGSGNNLLVESCYIHDNDSIATHGDGMQWFRSNNITFRYNVVKNCGQIFMLTEIWNSTSYDYVDNLNVYYNVFYNRSGTHYDGIKWKLAPRAGFAWRIYNNTFDLNAPLNPGDWEDRVMAGPASPNIDFRNNAVFNSRYGSIGDNSHSYNGYDNSGTYGVPDLPVPLNETGGIAIADLGMVSSATSDYHLLATSPLIGKGVNVGLTRDFDGNPVPATPSIGAFERSTTATPPTITSQPANVSVNVGQNATFSVAASGSALAYQWQRDGTNIAGAIAAAYTLSATKNSDTGATFRVIVSNAGGSVTSNSATLTVVNVAPVITSAATAAPNPAAVNQSVAFSVAASDSDPLTYSWAFGDGASASGSSAAHAYAGVGTYTTTVTVADGFGASASSSVTVIVNAVSASQTLLTTQRPANANNTDGAGVNYELGMRFKADVGGQITAIRFLKATSETGAHTGRVWSAAGSLLATVSFANETAAGWQEQKLAAPLSIAANTEYLVSVNTGNSYYVSDDTGFAAQIVNGHLRSIAGSNGRYGSPGKYPGLTWMSSNYFRDVRFTPNIAASAADAPTLTVTKLRATARYSIAPAAKSLNPGRDMATISGTLANVPAGFDPNGQMLALNMGGASLQFTLDKNGKGASKDGSVALKLAQGGALFTAKLMHGNFASSWGLTAKAGTTTVPVAVEIGDNAWSADVSVTCSKKSGGIAVKK